MPTIGFPIPTKENERRRSLLPEDLRTMRHAARLVFETGYGAPFGIEDDVYRKAGAAIKPRDAVCDCDIICDPKPVISNEYFRAGKTLFGWIHAVQDRAMADILVDNRMLAIAWEDMFEYGRHVFWRNNEISGEAAIAHAFFCLGKLPYEMRVAVIGRGNVAIGAIRALERAGCNVTVYNRQTSVHLRDQVGEYDAIVNAVLWDVFRTDHLVYEEDLDRMKPGSMIVDISCDREMGIQTSRPTTIEDPVYWHKGILHYSVDHVPTLFFRSATSSISTAVAPFVDVLAGGGSNPVLDQATIVRNGEILDERIIRFQRRCAPAAAPA